MNSLLSIVAIIGTIYVLVAYYLSTRWGRPGVFDTANAISFIPIGTASAVVGAWWAVIMNVTFGLIALNSLSKGRNWRRAGRTELPIV